MNEQSNDAEVEIENFEKVGGSETETNGVSVRKKIQDEVEDVNVSDSYKQLEDSLGELYLSLCYLKLDKSLSWKPSLLPEELEYNELDKSLENFNDKMNTDRIGDGIIENPLVSKEGQTWEESKRVNLREKEDSFCEMNPVNKEVMKLSMRLNGNRPSTPTLRYGTSSVHSDADSGIGSATPTKRMSDLTGMESPRMGNPSWGRMNSDNSDDIPATFSMLRNTPTSRSNRSYHFDSENYNRNTSSLRSNRSLNADHFLMNGTSPTADLKQFDAASLRSLTIPMGSTDGKRIIQRSETSPVELLNVTQKSFDDDFSSGGSYQISPARSFEDVRLPRRAQWANKAQFILACVGYSVGLGNIWRFPYVCYKSGGGAFLVLYFLTLLFCGIPLLHMELTIGQLTRRGPIGALGKLCPLFKGAGLSSVIISFIMSTYYNVIIAYTVFYFFSAFKTNAPWNNCNNPWNTPQCWIPSSERFNITKPNMSRTPSQEFYDNKVLKVTSGIEELGTFRWELAASLFVAWLMVYFAIWKSVKSSGKVVYFTATFPYVIILAFLVRSITLEGADVGLKYLLKPNWELLGDAKVWVNAAGQVFNSIGLAFGSIVSLASYNKPDNKILVDTMSVAVINALTSLLVAIFAFATIGNIAVEHNFSVHDVITDGPGLVFVVYPEAMAKMPSSQTWAVLFFFMLLCLGLNSQFAIVEVVVTTIQDGFPNWMRKRFVCHEVLVGVVCIVSFAFGLPYIFQGGIFFFQLVDHYAASISIMYLSFFELIAISWFFGITRLRKKMKQMTGETPSIYFRFCWCIAAPAFMISIWIFSLIDYEPPTYRNGSYKYPIWAEVLGWLIASLSLACIPLYAIYVYVTSEGKNYKEKYRNAVTPHLRDEEKFNQIARENGDNTRELDTLLKEKKLPTILPAGTTNR